MSCRIHCKWRLKAVAALLNSPRHFLSWMPFMLRSASAAFLALALVPAAHAAVDCSVNTSASPLPLPATTIAPVADELYIRGNQLGMPAGVLSSTRSVAVAGPGAAAPAHRWVPEHRQGHSERTGGEAERSGGLQAADRIRQHALALRHEPERQAHDRRRVRRLDEGAWRVVKARPAPAATPAAAEAPAETKPVDK